MCVGGRSRSVFFARALPLFDISLVSKKKPLSTIVIIHSDKALINQRNRGDVIKLAIKISKLLVYLFLTEFNLVLQISKHSDIQVLKILTA